MCTNRACAPKTITVNYIAYKLCSHNVSRGHYKPRFFLIKKIAESLNDYLETTKKLTLKMSIYVERTVTVHKQLFILRLHVCLKQFQNKREHKRIIIDVDLHSGVHLLLKPTCWYTTTFRKHPSTFDIMLCCTTI